MKKTNKKINGLVKVILLICMIFSQLATPTKVLADQIVPSYNIEMTLDTEIDKFVVKSNGTELVEENYILEIIRSFSFKNTDGTINETKHENSNEYRLVSGSLLTTGINDIEHETFTYNGVSYINVNVYEINTEDPIDISTYTKEVHQTLLTEEKLVNIMSTSFEEGISSNETKVSFEITGEGIVCDTTEGYKCSFTKNDTNNMVEINYSLSKGNFNPNNEYHTVLKVNGVVMDLVTENIDTQLGSFKIDFSRLIPGVYNVEYSVRDKENQEIVTNKIEFTYEIPMNNETTTEEVTEPSTESDAISTEEGVGESIPSEEVETFDRIEFIKNSEVYPELFYSYTLLTEEEKNTLGDSYRFLDTPLAYVFDKTLTNENITINYNLFNNSTRYHVITSEKFMGTFTAEDANAYTVDGVINELSSRLMPKTKIYIVDANGQLVNGASYIQNGMKLIVNILGVTLEYDFLVYGDVNGGYVDDTDLNNLIDKVLNNNFSYYDEYNLDLNKDKLFNITDISILGANIGLQDYEVNNEFEVVDTITSTIESDKNELFAGESFEVILSLNGFSDEGNYINALEGLISYDETALTLDKVEMLNNSFVGSNVGNRVIYATSSTYSTNEEKLIKLSFTSKIEGIQKVSVTNLNLVADGKQIANTNSNELEINVKRPLHTDANLKSLYSSVGYFTQAFNSEVLDYTLYVDSSVNYITFSGELNDEYATCEDLKQYVLTGDNTTISINVTAEDGTVKTYRVNVIKVYKSSNNNLSNIVIEGYEINFNKDTLEYSITVGSDVTSLNISALVEHYGAWAKIEGNENFQEGENTVTITVYAENGSSKSYKLLVNKEKAVEETPVVDDEEEKENNVNTEKVVIIILIVLVVIGLLYLIFKKDEDEEPRIEQIKPKKDNEVKFENTKNTNNNKDKFKNNNKKQWCLIINSLII